MAKQKKSLFCGNIFHEVMCLHDSQKYRKLQNMKMETRNSEDLALQAHNQ